MKGIKNKYLKLSFLIHVMSILTFVFSYGAYTMFQYIKFTKRPNKVKEQAFIPNTVSLAQLSAAEQEVLKNQIQKTLKKVKNLPTPTNETISKTTTQKNDLQITPQTQDPKPPQTQETTPLKTEEPTKQESEIKNKEEKPKNKEKKPTKKTKPNKTGKQNNSTEIKSLKENIENKNSKEIPTEVPETQSEEAMAQNSEETFLKEQVSSSQTISDQDIIRYQIIRAWSQFDGFDETASSLIVPVNIKLDINGRLISVIERDSGHFSFLSKKQKKVYKDMFSKAKLAIQEATPIEGLNKNNFQKWKSIDLDFKVETGFY